MRWGYDGLAVMTWGPSIRADGPIEHASDIAFTPAVKAIPNQNGSRGLTPHQRLELSARRMGSFIGWVGLSTCAAISPPRTGSVRSSRPAWTSTEAWSQ